MTSLHPTRLLVPALLALLPATASVGSVRPPAEAHLGWQIAAQGDQALAQIRADSRAALREQSRPALTEYIAAGR